MSEWSAFIGSTPTVVVLRESYNMHDQAPRPDRFWVRADLTATWLPELGVLHVLWEPSWRGHNCAPEISVNLVANHSAAVRKAVEVADQVKSLIAIVARDKDVRARVLNGMALMDAVRTTTASHDPHNL